MAAVGPGVIVLGASIGGGEFLLGPDRLRPSRPDAALGHDGGRLLPDGLQHRADALHARHRRAGVHRFHADAAACRRSGPGSTPCSSSCRSAGPRGRATAAGAIFFLFTGRHRRRGRRRCRLSDRRRHVPGCAWRCCCSDGASSARSSCSTGSWSCAPGRVARPGAVLFRSGRGRPRWRDSPDSTRRGGVFDFLPADADFLLLGAFVAYSGLRRDDQHHAVELGARQGLRDGAARRLHSGRGRRTARCISPHTGFIFTPDADSPARAGAAGGASCAPTSGACSSSGAMLGMMLPALLYVTFLPAGTDIRGLGISAALAQQHRRQRGGAPRRRDRASRRVAPVQDPARSHRGLVRAITDILWTGSRRVRAWRGGDVRAVYYTVLVLVVLWGIIALRLAQPVILLQIAANVAGLVFVVARCTCCTSTRASCRPRSVPHARAAPCSWRCRCSTDSSCSTRSGA